MVVQTARRLFTTDDYHRMLQIGVLTEDDRVELLAGDIWQMSPISSRHAACVNRLTQLLSSILRERAIVSVQNPIHLGRHSEPQPDLALLQLRDDFYADAHPEPEDVLLVIEVAETSQEYDRTVKLPLYAQAGISLVWLVDLINECVQTYSNPTPQGYSEIHQFWRGQSVTLTPFPDVSVAVNDILG